MSTQPLKSDASPSWGVACRPTLLFVVAFALNVTPHEVVHAVTSYLLGFNSTVFQMVGKSRFSGSYAKTTRHYRCVWSPLQFGSRRGVLGALPAAV
jgi:hypothetical protein